MSSAAHAFHIHNVRPYQLLAFTRSADFVRIGSSTANRSEPTVDRLRDMIARSPADPFVQLGGAIRIGVRLHVTGSFAQDWVTPRLCFVYGFGKMGFALAPALAQEVIQKLERSSVYAAR